MPIPEVATVIAKVYIDIIKLKVPIASAPTLLEIYILKTNPTPRIRRVVTVKIKPLIKNIFVFLKSITI